MSTLKSSSTDLTLNADGVGNDIIFQSNAGQVGSLTAEGVLTATSYAGSGAALTGVALIADDVIDEANLKVSNGPTNGYVLTAQSGASGGLTWAADSTTDSTKLPLAGGTMTGNLVMGANLVDGIDISARDAVLTSTTTTAGAALPKAGGTMTGNIVFNDTIRSVYGTSSDGLEIYHDGSDSYINDTGTGDVIVKTDGAKVKLMGGAEQMVTCAKDGAVDLYHNNVKTFATTANGVSVTGAAVGTLTTDNDGSFALSASNHFKCTPSGNFTLTFTGIVSQSGNILLINSGGHTVSAHANTKVDAKFLSTISTAGTYLLAYFSDGTNVYMTNSAIYT